jgi:pimeloyl-ACP methyl ester carboxylesterase
MKPDPETRFTSDGDVRLRYLEWPGDGSPVVLLHGLTVSAEYWSHTARILAENHRVIAADLRGHGHSDKPGWGYDYPTLASDVEQLCDEAGVEGALIAGHSWGASVALMLAAEHPGRVAYLAMVDGGFGGRRRQANADGAPPNYESMMAPMEIYRTRKTYLEAAGGALSEVAGPELEAVLMASVTVNGDGSISERLSRENQVLILKEMGNLNVRELYERVRAPVLFAGALGADGRGQEWNERKRESVRRARELIPNSVEHWFPDTAHDIQLHRPRELAAALEGFVRAN